MNLSEITKITVASIGATAFMTLFLYLLDFVLNERRLKVVKVLGTMLTNQTAIGKGLSEKPSAISAGIIGHYAVGIAFAIAFLMLVNVNWLQFDYRSGLIFGMGAGIIGAITWNIYFAAHPNPPHLNILLYSVAIFCGHIVFGLSLVLMFKIIENVIEKLHF